MNVDDFSMNPLFFKHFASFECFPDQVTGCENRNISSLVKHNSFPDFKFLICRREDRNNRTTKTQVNRALVFCNGNCCSFRLIVIAWIDNDHSG